MENRKFLAEQQRMKELMGLKSLSEAKELEVFPVGGNKYNIGYDEKWNDFDKPSQTANSDFSKTPTGAGAGGHPKGHFGIDIFGPKGATIYAPVDGVVKHNKSNGNTVIIQDKDGYSHWLGHLDTITVDEDVIVRAGTKVGTLGDSGNAKGTAPHLHYNVYKTEDGFYSASDPFNNLKNSIGKEPDSDIEVGDDTPKPWLGKLEDAFDDFIDSEEEDDEKKSEIIAAKDEQDMFDILIDKGKKFIEDLLG